MGGNISLFVNVWYSCIDAEDEDKVAMAEILSFWPSISPALLFESSKLLIKLRVLMVVARWVLPLFEETDIDRGCFGGVFTGTPGVLF